MEWIRGRTEERLATITRIGIDATFKVLDSIFGGTIFFQVAPENYQQLLILHVHIGGKELFCNLKAIEIFYTDTFWAPLFSVLMPWRNEDCYIKAYELIDNATPFPWPENLNVMMDFEQAIILIFFQTDLDFKQPMRNAWSALHPSHKLRGCMFHMTQVIRLAFFSGFFVILIIIFLFFILIIFHFFFF